jgi:hypothetical protein
MFLRQFLLQYMDRGPCMERAMRSLYAEHSVCGLPCMLPKQGSVPSAARSASATSSSVTRTLNPRSFVARLVGSMLGQGRRGHLSPV